MAGIKRNWETFVFGIGACVALLGGCSAGSPGDGEPDGTTAQPIVFGTASNDPALAAVGSMVYKWPKFGISGFSCSGTLIAPQVFLTARHCVEETPASVLTVPSLNNFVTFGANVTKPEQKVKIKAFLTAPRGPAPGLLGDGGRDVAVLYLDEAPRGIVPAKLGHFDASMLGSQFRIAGYGWTEAYTVGNKVVGNATARALSGDWYPLLFNNDYAAFDQWYWTDSSLATPSPAEEQLWWSPNVFTLEPGYEALVGGLPGDAVSCFGDSGGPVFRGSTAQDFTVYGVDFAGEGSFATACALGSGYLVLNDEILAFIQQAVAAAPTVLAQH
jgi:hypothetical protein